MVVKEKKENEMTFGIKWNALERDNHSFCILAFAHSFLIGSFLNLVNYRFTLMCLFIDAT